MIGLLYCNPIHILTNYRLPVKTSNNFGVNFFITIYSVKHAPTAKMGVAK